MEQSELPSELLEEGGVPHNLLNAKPENVQKEVFTVAQSGRKGAVTIATNMAGHFATPGIGGGKGGCGGSWGGLGAALEVPLAPTPAAGALVDM